MKRFCLCLCLIVAPLGHSPVMAQLAQVAAGGFKFLLGYFGGKGLDELLDGSGKANPQAMKKLQSQLDAMARQMPAHAAKLNELSRKLETCATKEEVRAAMLHLLRHADEQLARHAEKLLELERAKEDIYRQIGYTERRMTIAEQNLNRVTGRVEQTESATRLLDQTARLQANRLRQVEAELEEIKRFTPHQQSERLALAGFEHYRANRLDEAAQYFLKSHAYNPKDPIPLYACAIAYHAQGKEEVAAMIAAKGAVVERDHPLQAYHYSRYNWEKMQGKSRVWLESVRSDPLIGPRASDIIRIVEIAPLESHPHPDRRTAEPSK